ncbi:predicted protein [Nematostella vectensis]|uniref:Uncharacterized protein n=1 Tax=Nematostella vectensis TaxID=45351 RepID=A7SEL0_NEMVE|nr:predicted protein [Nematostella vectensis]|eukprot:XP_001629869.1 predicted protein [Nematostella vectensis]
MPGKYLPVLDLSGPAFQGTERCRKWKRAFKYYAEVQSLTDAQKKTARLLHFACSKTFKTLAQYPRKIMHSRKRLESWIITSKLTIISRTRDTFRQMAPTEGETADQFTVRLQKQAAHCNFGTALEDNLRDQLIERVKNLELKK